MNKRPTPTPEENIWDDTAETVTPVEPSAKPTKLKKPAEPELVDREFDIEGLMTDFPTAKDLERFVYDETGIVLNLKGRANKLKYQIAMDTLNGVSVEERYVGKDNPYLDKTDLVPEEPLKTLPPRDPAIPDRTDLQNEFFTAFVPH